MSHPGDTRQGATSDLDHVPEADGRVVLHDVSWDDLEKFLSIKGDRGVPRVAYLDGSLELMSPGHRHEIYKSIIGHLVETYMLELGIVFNAVGSWTISNRHRKATKEPDECYVFGTFDPDADNDARRPDLAIEIVWTRPQLDVLEVYRRLGVPEVWIWKEDAIRVHVLVADKYEERAQSESLPGLDLELVCKLAHSSSVNEAGAGLEAGLAQRTRNA